MDKNNTGPEMVEPGDRTTEGDLGYFEQWLAEFEWLRVIFSDGSIITKLPVLQPPETREQMEITSLRESLATAKVEAAAAERKQHEYRQLLLEQDAEIHMLEQALRSQLARKHVTGEVGTQTEPKKRALKAPDADKPRKRTKKASSAFHQALAAPDTVAVASSAVASASCALEGQEQLTSPPPTTSGTPASLLTAATTEPNCLESTSSGQLVSVAAETFAVATRAVALATCASEGQRPAASATPRAPTRLSLSATIVPARHESTPNDQSGHRSTNVWDASDEDFVELQSQAKKRRGPTPNKKV